MTGLTELLTREEMRRERERARMYREPPPRWEPMVLGAAVNVQGNSAAVVGVTRHPEEKDRIAVRYCKVWGILDWADLKAELVRLTKEYMTAEVACGAGMENVVAELRKRRTGNFKMFPDNARPEADTGLLVLIAEKRLATGKRADLREHVANAHRKTLDNGLVLLERGRGPIEAAVALSMACARFVHLNL